MKKFLLALTLCCLSLSGMAFAQSNTPSQAHHDHAAHAEKSCTCATEKKANADDSKKDFAGSSGFSASAKGCDAEQKQHCAAGHCPKECDASACADCCAEMEMDGMKMDEKSADHAHHH